MPETYAFILDTSRYLRNGDMAPSRYDQQLTTVEGLVRNILRANMENACSITAAGETPDLLCPMTHDERNLINGILKCKQDQRPDFPNAILQARLAIKNRLKKNGTTTIVCFIGSPIEEDMRESFHKRLLAACRILRKESTGIVFVLFGERLTEETANMFKECVDAANKNGNSLVISHNSDDRFAQLKDTVSRSQFFSFREPEYNALEDAEMADALRQIAQAEGQEVPHYDEFEDPELAEAIRMSLLDYNANQHRDQEDKEEIKEESEVKPRVEEPPSDTVSNVVQTSGQIDYTSPKLKQVFEELGLDISDVSPKDSDKKEDKDKGNEDE